MLDKQSVDHFDEERLLCQYVIYREAVFGVRGWARLVDSDVVDLDISMIITNLAYHGTVPGSQPNQGTVDQTGTRLLPGYSRHLGYVREHYQFEGIW